MEKLSRKLVFPYFLFLLLLIPTTSSAQQLTIEDLIKQISALQAQLVQLQNANQPANGFNTNLYFGLRGNSDVSRLQEFLTKQNHYSGPINGNYFSMTMKAVQAFQAAQDIETSGYFGVLTRAATNRLISSNSSPQPPLPPSTPTSPPILIPIPSPTPTPPPPQKHILNLLSPNGGETLVTKSQEKITWKHLSDVCGNTFCEVSGSYDITLREESILPTSYVITKSIQGTSYTWIVGSVLADVVADGAYRIQVCQSGTLICDSSDSYFKIVTPVTRQSVKVITPNGGEQWEKGSQQTINWSQNYPDCYNCGAPARNYELSVESACQEGMVCNRMYTPPYIIAQNLFNIYTYSWNVGSSLSGTVPDGTYVLKVCDFVTGECDRSDSVFYVISKSEPISSISISGYVFNDVNGDGIMDNGEPRLSGRPVNLTDRTDIRSLQPVKYTDANGYYIYYFSSDGQEYRIKHVIPAGWVRTNDDSRPDISYGAQTWNFGIKEDIQTVSSASRNAQIANILESLKKILISLSDINAVR